MKRTRVGTGVAFHETLCLSRVAVTEVLRFLPEIAEEASERPVNAFDYLRSKTSLGTNYVKVMPRYARAMGLVGSDNRLTAFGAIVVRVDGSLSSAATQWLMHYFACAPHPYTPRFWRPFLGRILDEGGGSSRSLSQVLEEVLSSISEPSVSAKTLRSTATVVLGTYTKPEALGGLGILRKEGEVYRVGQPAPPPAAVVGYAIAHYWEQQWTGLTTVNLDRLSEPGGPAEILLLSQDEMERALSELARQQVLQVERRVPPYQVVRQWASADELLERVYD